MRASARPSEAVRAVRSLRSERRGAASPGGAFRRRRSRRGLALADVVIAGVMLGIGMTVILSLASRSLNMQTHGEKRMIASWLADELISMVLVEGPDAYGRHNETSGRFGPPFAEFAFEVKITSPGSANTPYPVSAIVSWDGNDDPFVRVDASIALRIEYDEEIDHLREPYEPLDREERWYEKDLAEQGER